jgi:DNA-nicking Smr family endonuclease
VLKKLVQGWLAQKREVLAYCQARATEGGAGAVIVLLSAKQ